MDDLLAKFATEAGESLAELDVALLTLEQAPGDAQALGRAGRGCSKKSSRSVRNLGLKDSKPSFIPER
jgi:hypothetical protein